MALPDQKQWQQFTQWAVNKGVDPAALNSYYDSQLEAEGIRQGYSLTGVPTGQRGGVIESLLRGGYKEETEEDLAQKRKLSVSAGLGQQLATLETQRRQMEKRGPTKGWIPAQLPFLGVQEPEAGGFETARNLTAYRIADVLAEQTGRAVSDTEFKAFRDALPTRRDADVIAVDKLNASISLLEDKLRGEGIDKATIKQIIEPAREAIKETEKVTPTTGGAAAGQIGPTQPTTTGQAPPWMTSAMPTQAGLAAGLQAPPKGPPGIISKLAGAQEKMGSTEILPASLGIAGQMAGGTVGMGPLGAGVGTALGELMKQGAKGRGLWSVISPNVEEKKSAGTKGAVAAATSWGLPKLLHPFKTASKFFGGASEKLAEKAGVTVTPEMMTDAAIEFAEKRLPKIMQQPFLDMAEKAIQEGGFYKGAEVAAQKHLLPYVGGQAAKMRVEQQVQQFTKDALMKQLYSQGGMGTQLAERGLGVSQAIPYWLKRGAGYAVNPWSIGRGIQGLRR